MKIMDQDDCIIMTIVFIKVLIIRITSLLTTTFFDLLIILIILHNIDNNNNHGTNDNCCQRLFISIATFVEYLGASFSTL